MIKDTINVEIAGGLDFSLSKMIRVQQKFSAPKIDDIASVIKKEFARESIKNKVLPGQKIAVGCGSRGVANIAAITKAVIEELIKLGAKPFIFPCMGSHGAATAEGQKQVLAGYGITEEIMAVPIHATMDTEIVGQLDDGTPVHMDSNAAHADGIVVINRVKPHTSFRGQTESGITKMLAIGIGKINGAAIYHQHGMDMFPTLLPKIRDVNINKRNVLFGVGIVENAFDQTALIEVIPAEEIHEKEPPLQVLAKQNMPKLNFSNIDVLIIEEMGKNISGAGFDPNITGRNRRAVQWDSGLHVKKIVVLRITPESHGNATGIGGADVTTMRLYRDMDIGATYANVITAMNLDGAAIPIIMNSDREAIALAIKTVVRTKPEDCRIVRIKNTLSLGEIDVSTNMLEEVTKNPDLFEIISEAQDWKFDYKNNLQAID
ncbi:MAG: lactate racemase domain-containing protein [Proteobacteria bacterium]|nr:lactate racemase domain-containing protein [Pseudomonadota bacterium]MDA1331049.1 lactate racemase domain-containing protein [Pseudomonadota bacterium]